MTAHATDPREPSDRRRWRRTAVAAALSLGVVAVPAPAAAQAGGTAGFPDVPAANVHAEAISELAEAGILLGRADGRFSPRANVTRGQLASVIARAAELELPATSAFTDTRGSVHEGAIAALAEAGVVRGYSATTFRPNEPILRDHAAVIVSRWLGAEPVADGPFTDVTRYAGEINALHELGIIGGTTATTFRPSANIRRDQTATVIANTLSPVELRLLYINDLHGALEPPTASEGGAAYLAAYVNRYASEADNSLFLGGGDLIGAAPPISGLTQEQSTLDVLGAMGMDASAVGNHEFDQGYPELRRLIDGGVNPVSGEMWGGMDFPFLGANVIDDATGEPAFPTHETFRVQGIPVAFIGVGLTNTPGIVVSGATAGLTFQDEAEATNRVVEELAADGQRAMLVSGHVGGTAWVEALDERIDVAFGGHSHSRTDTVVGGIPLLQAGSNGRTMAVVDLSLDKFTRDVVDVSTELVTIAHEGVTPDPEIAALVADYAAEVEVITNQVIGESTTTITRSRNDAGESALGNLIADAQLAETGTDFAFMNAGGIRADIAAGPVTWGDLYTVQPFGNTLITMSMTGAQVERLLEQQWQGGSAMLQIAGLSYVWDADAPAGDRVVEITDADGVAVQADATYSVTANVFLAGGGDGYSVLAEPDDQVIGANDLDALVDFVRGLEQPFTYAIDGRITRLP